MPTAPTVLLANEIGMGRGHIANLAQVVKHLGKDFSFSAGLYRKAHTEELHALGVETFVSKGMHFSDAYEKDPATEGQATWGDYLFATGLAREDVLRRNLHYWIDQISRRSPAVLVAEYAPIAMLAAHVLRARGMALKTLAVGTAFSVPPATMATFPILLPDYTHSVHQEAEVLALINRILAENSAPPLPSIPALYAVDLALPMAFAQFDPYRKWRDPSELVLPNTITAPHLDNRGDEVFVYLSYTLQEPTIWDALCDLPLPRRAYLPVASQALKARLRMAGVMVEDTPVPIDLLAARSRLVLNMAQLGTVQMAAVLGLPQVGLPMHLEHSFHGRRAGQKGVMELLERRQRSKDNIINLILRSYHSATMQTRAREFAAELAAEASDQSRSLTARLAPIASARFGR